MTRGAIHTGMVAGNRVRLLHDGEQCLPAMLEAIDRAQREILLEMYWFGSDATGRRFADALSRRARDGIRVCVTYDAAGSWQADRGMFDAMRDAGCGVYEYRPISLWRWGFNNRRNHRKMLVVDGRLGQTGGINLADEWAPEAEGGQGFRDDMIEVEGPAVAAMRTIFIDTYRGDGHAEARAEDLGCDEAVGECKVRILANDRRRLRRLIQRAYLERIRSAATRVLITNSYFVPSLAIRSAMGQAVERAVDVRVLVPAESDVPAVDYATRYLFGGLLRRGVRVFQWSRSILHTKTAVVDGQWCTVGTHNLDYRSWAYNLEINVAVDDAQVAVALEARMQADMEMSSDVKLTDWKYRPISQRVMEAFFFAWRKLL